MTAPLNDAWEGIREIFPLEHSKHFEILEYIRIHPGCGASEIRAYFDACNPSGLMRVLFQMYRDGDVNMDGSFRFFPKGVLGMSGGENNAGEGDRLRFFVSKVHNSLNGIPYNPEIQTPYLCLNPYYNVVLAEDKPVNYLLDSGAFQDVKGNRLTCEQALERQLAFEKSVGRNAYAIVSYDRLVDEQMADGIQIKSRVSREVGESYVMDTIEAAEYLSSRREELEGRRLVLSCQGSDTEQYLDCMKQVISIADPGDTIGIGGFCILSKSKQYERQFYEVIREGFPMMRDAGITSAHIFGMGVFRALVQADIWGRMNGIDVSYDTSAAEMNAVFGKSFNPIQGQMSKVFSKQHKNKGYRSSDLSMLNVRLIMNYWDEVERMPLPEEFTPGMVD